MKTVCGAFVRGCFLVLSLFLCSLEARVIAQTSGAGSTVPTVIVQATDPVASQSGDPGAFTFFRQGGTNMDLNVYYQISGTASNGVDYAQIGNWILIPAGIVSRSVPIKPINPHQTNTLTVVLQLAPSPLMMPVNYEIGAPSNATVYIKGAGVTNLPPVVNLISPADGTLFYTPTNIQMLAKAGDLDGLVTGVEFFAGTNDLGSGLPVVLDPPGVNGMVGLVYFLAWNNPSPGNYALKAVATDNDGATNSSDLVNISVLPGPPANQPPVVRITSPANGSIFRLPMKIPIYAYGNDPDSAVVSVEFFAGATSLGFGQPVTIVPPPLPPGPVQPPILVVVPTNYWELTWNNPQVGVWPLSAVATDNAGASTTSSVVNITIMPPLPPPTNRPPIVSIVATDPVAVEGTNGWTWPGETNSTPTWAAWPTAVCRSFTNYGPKNAVFTLRRCGDTNDALVVNYDLGGSASNGVDYVTLPGVATIAAGELAAMITLVPIDDGPPEVSKTVVLRLAPATNTPPDFIIGFPKQAAAVILDGVTPRAAAGLLPCGCFHLVKPGPDGAWFCIESSTNLTGWTPVCTNQVINGSIDFVDADAAKSSGTFYRVVPVFNAP